MKQLAILAAVILFGTVSCSSTGGDKSNSIAQNSSDNQITLLAQGKMVSEPVQLNKQAFLDQIMDYENNPQEWVYKGDMPGIVDFYADWCGPCKVTSPILEELAKEYAGKIVIYKVDVDVERELSSVFGIQSIPTFLFMPMEGNPSLSSGIAQTPEATREMFVRQIETILLESNKETSSL